MSKYREKFIDELVEQLERNNIPDEDMILADYISMYDDKISKGMTDMEVIISLGDPADIVKSLKNNTLNTDRQEALKENLKATVSDLINENISVKSAPKNSKKKSSIASKTIQPKAIPKVKAIPAAVSGKAEPTKTLPKAAMPAIEPEIPVTEQKDKLPLKKPLPESNADFNKSDKRTSANIKVKKAKLSDKKAGKEKELIDGNKLKAKNKKAKKPKKPKKKHLFRLILFILLVLTSMLIPAGIIYAGLNMLTDIPLKSRIIISMISVGVAVLSGLLNSFFRKIVQNMVIKRQ